MAQEGSDEHSNSTRDIRQEVWSTLENASRSGRLNEVLALHRPAKMRQQCMNNGRSGQNRRDQQIDKVEDTRDLDQLLLELGETPTSKAGKGKKKTKKTIATQESTVAAEQLVEVIQEGSVVATSIQETEPSSAAQQKL